MDITELMNVADCFDLEGTCERIAAYGEGHINDTYLVEQKIENGTIRKYILQKMNQNIFHDVKSLMLNISQVTAFLNRKILESGGDPWRETLNVIKTKSGEIYYTHKKQGAWRVYLFIEDTLALQLSDTPELFYESGVSFGRFQNLLADYPAHQLVESIPDFHNTPKRYQDFLQMVAKDPLLRGQTVQEEIRFLKQRQAEMNILTELLGQKALPLRVTHNDTKLNNILFDKNTGKGLCVIDLDTVMPGLCHYDYGDAIRFGASSALEDETDLTQVFMRLDLFEAFTKGFLEMVGKNLTAREKEYLPLGAKIMTLECGMRFLADHIAGDVYFKTSRPNHNLDRARNQFALVKDMERKEQEMKGIVAKYS